MSIDVMNCVWKHAPVASGEFAVLLALADYADENCTCYPGVETLAAKARLKPRQTQNCVKSLAKTGLITVERGAGPKGCNRYRVEVETIRARSIRQDATQAIKSAINDDDADVESDDDLGEGGANIAPPQSATGGVHSSASGGAMECTQTIIEPSKIPSDERERARANNDLDGENGKTETPVPDENPKAVEREFEKSFRDWPTSISDSRPAALTEWRKLTPDERQMAALEADRYRTACRATGRKVVCAFAVYLREKRWADLPEREPEPLKPVEAPPFGKLWTAERMRRLLAGPEVTDYPLTAFEQKSIDAGTMDRKTVIRGKQVHQGLADNQPGWMIWRLAERGCS